MRTKNNRDSRTRNDDVVRAIRPAPKVVAAVSTFVDATGRIP